MVLNKLAEVRKAQGMTQVELADAVLLSERTIINLEGGGSTTENNAKRLAIILRVKTEELI
jgi:DNA-binding XRE family transcriptional regulator